MHNRILPILTLFLTLPIAIAHPSWAVKSAPLTPARGVSASEIIPASVSRSANLWAAEPSDNRESLLLPPIQPLNSTSRNGQATARTPDGEVVAQCAGRNDTDALAGSVKAANGKWIVIANGTTCAVTEITIPNLRIERGGLLKPLSSHTVTLTANFDAGLYKVFTNIMPGEGAVSFADNSSIREAVPQWWGGNPDGATPNQAYISAAINCGAKRVFLTAGDWKITAPISWQKIFVTLSGASRLSTYLSAGAGVPAIIKFEGGASSGGGYVIENIRFNGFSGTNFNGYALDATVNTFIDSVVRNCWFGLSVAARGAFDGKAVNAIFDGNTFELGKNTLHFSLASLTHITNNVFYECYHNLLDFDGMKPESISGVHVNSNIVLSHHNGNAIHAKNAVNLHINGFTYYPLDSIPAADLVNSFPTVLDLDNAEVMASNIKVIGVLAYLDSDAKHVGTSYIKVKHGVRLTNSTLQISDSVIGLTEYGVYVSSGTVNLKASNVQFNQQSKDGVFLQSVTGSVNLNNIKINRPGAMWINQAGTTSADLTIQGSQFYDAQWMGRALSSGFLFTTKGIFLFSGNTVVRTGPQSAVTSFLDLTLSDGKGWVDGNLFLASEPLGGGNVKPGSTGFRLGRNFGPSETR